MIKELDGEKLVGYACISSSAFSREKKEAVRATKAYAEIEAAIKSLKDKFMNPDLIYVDVLPSANRPRYYLNEIIDTFCNGKNWYCSPKGTIVIESLAALGTKSEMAAKNYLNLVKADIGILILGSEHETFSTVDYGCSYICDLEKRAALAERVREVELKSKRGAKPTAKTFTAEFKELYWLYENYFITEELVYNNTLAGRTTHNTFARYCTAYEQSPEYAADEAQQCKNGIHEKPKRHGKLPAQFQEYCDSIIDEDKKRKEICAELGISEITFKRFRRKGTGRKAMAQASYAYRDDDLIRRLTPDSE